MANKHKGIADSQCDYSYDSRPCGECDDLLESVRYALREQLFADGWNLPRKIVPSIVI